MKLYTFAFALIIGAALIIGDGFANIAVSAAMLLASGVCIAIAEVRAK